MTTALWTIGIAIGVLAVLSVIFGGLLGFAAVPEAQIVDAVARLRQAWRV